MFPKSYRLTNFRLIFAFFENRPILVEFVYQTFDYASTSQSCPGWSISQGRDWCIFVLKVQPAISCEQLKKLTKPGYWFACQSRRIAIQIVDEKNRAAHQVPKTKDSGRSGCKCAVFSFCQRRAILPARLEFHILSGPQSKHSHWRFAGYDF